MADKCSGDKARSATAGEAEVPNDLLLQRRGLRGL